MRARASIPAGLARAAALRAVRQAAAAALRFASLAAFEAGCGVAAAARAAEAAPGAPSAWPCELLGSWGSAEVAALVVGAGVTTLRRLRRVYER